MGNLREWRIWYKCYVVSVELTSVIQIVYSGLMKAYNKAQHVCQSVVHWLRKGRGGGCLQCARPFSSPVVVFGPVTWLSGTEVIAASIILKSSNLLDFFWSLAAAQTLLLKVGGCPSFLEACEIPFLLKCFKHYTSFAKNGAANPKGTVTSENPSGSPSPLSTYI